LSHESIAAYAETFLGEHGIHSVPVDIEWIIESKYTINIIPTPGLKRLINIEGFITSDCTCLYVDEDVQSKYYNRYRFTLAHEMGHLYMHGEILSRCNIGSINDWKSFITELDSSTYNKLEYQANYFSGLVLVPSPILSRKFDEALTAMEPMKQQAKRNDVGRNAYLPYMVQLIAEELSREFEVSKDVINRRIENDMLSVRI
jgi:Zn-dependent peptidase ImmA (M78 family)